MSKTAQERYSEIQKEIWQISESYTSLTKNKLISELNNDEMRHLEFLHYRLRELVGEMKTFSYEEVNISLIYKKLVNKLMYDLSWRVSQEYANELRETTKTKDSIGSINILL